jgi:beta-1,4-mannosyl-glycoprotein beta-1,4-N-acetylglucosaminyltransferase
MKFSVIIPTYKHLSDCLKPCLESIIKYTDTDIEVIVVANGCSNDGTREFVESLGFKLIWFNEAIGYTKATNEGIKVATGDYIILLNNDTILLDQPKNQWLEMLVDPFEKNEKVGITGPMYVHCPFADRNFLIFFCVCIKRELFDRVGLLDEIFSPGFGEDSDFCIKAQNAGCEIVQVPHKSDNYEKPNFMVGGFPIWHKGERTFENYPEGNKLLAKNRFILMNCYNQNIKLNLGCGDKKLSGYFNIDISNPTADLVWDVRKILLDDNKVDEIVVIHLLEHFAPEEVSDILREWYRILKPNGKLILELPDIEELCKNFASGTKQERYLILNCIYGSMMPEFPHRFGWYEDILRDHLSGVGFTDITRKPVQFEHWGHNLRIESVKLSQTLPDGFFGQSDIASYRDLIRDRVPNGGIIAELGSWKGRSLCSIVDIIKEKNLKVIIIDTFTGSKSETEGMASQADASKENIKEIFLSNISKFELHPDIYQGTTHDISQKFSDGYFDFVFIDADHAYESVLQDIQDWWPKVKRGGLLAGHDCQWKPVADALTTEFGHLVLTNWDNIWFIDKHKVYDCFTFNDELDLLEIRLNELNDEVDYFVLVEGTETHSGKSKPLYFEENKQRFEKFLPKIRHIIVDKWPEYIEGVNDSAWTRERMQRDAIIQGIQDARFCDVLIISDIDEIPRAEAIRNYSRHKGITSLEMNLYYYYVNLLSDDNYGKWTEGKIVPMQEFSGKTPCQIRYWNKDSKILNAGWHFSYQCGVEAIVKKIESWAHQEYNKPEIKNEEMIKKIIDEGNDIFGRNLHYSTVKIDNSYPKFLRENLDKFRHMIKDNS